MKKVAIIGCSHTDWFQGNKERVGWVEQLSLAFPSIEFHSFAAIAHGPLYYDLVLKHIITEYPENYFDGVIVQLTGKGRWLFPIRHTIEEEKWIVIPFPTRDVPNYIVHSLKSQRVCNTPNGDGGFMYGSNLREGNEFNFIPHPLATKAGHIYVSIDEDSTYDPCIDYDNFALQYEDLFIKSLEKIYAKHFNTFLFFSFFNSLTIKNEKFEEQIVGNIGYDKPFVQYAIEKYGEEKVATDFFDVTWHTNQTGEDVFFTDYILSSDIAKYLRKIE